MPPPPKPKHLRQNRNKHAELGIVPARSEPLAVPKPPTGLQAKARRVWRAYWKSQVSNAADRDADWHRIERWIQLVDEHYRVYEVFRKARLAKGSTGQPVLNPLAAYLQQLEMNISRAETELGLTPMARLRLGVTYGQAMLTAEALNKALDERPSSVEVSEVPAADWTAEWEAI